MNEIEVDVFRGHNNMFSLYVKIDDVGQDLVAQNVSRMVINTDTGLQLDSDEEGEGSGQPFDWTDSDTTLGLVNFLFGGITELVAGKHFCWLTIFDPAHTAGQVWPTRFFMNVYDQIVT